MAERSLRSVSHISYVTGAGRAGGDPGRSPDRPGICGSVPGPTRRGTSASEDAQAFGVVERRDLEPGWPVPGVGPHPEVARLQPFGAHAVLAGHLRQRDRTADRVAVGGGANVADPPIGEVHGL